MLVALLRKVDAEGSVHLGTLADEFGVTVQAVRDMLTDLALRGYLKPAGGDCSTKCNGCAFATSCRGTALDASWQVTERGRALVGERAPPRR